MKHAICLLCNGALNKIMSFIKQFGNHPDINIYIHYHKKQESDDRIISFLSKTDNVKCVISDYATTRFSCDMVRAELALYEYALQDNDDNVVFHLMSETDYMICSPQYFVDYFNKYKDFDFITYVHDKRVIQSGPDIIMNPIFAKFPKDTIYFCKASQQKSLSRSTVEQLLKFKDIIESILANCEGITKQIPGAIDEFVIPIVVYNLIGSKSIGAKRYVNWCNIYTGHPNILRLDDYKNETKCKEYEYIDYIILENFIIRKIDVNVPDSLAFLYYFRNRFKKIEHRQRKINNI